jgi:conjugative transfer region protein TrbK
MRSVRSVALVVGCCVVGLMVGTAPAQSGSAAAGDALAGELRRCKELREGATTDARCQAIYKQNWDQFFAPGKPYEPGAVDMFPKTPDRPLTPPRSTEP